MGGTRGHIAIVASNYWPEPTGVSRTVTEFAEFLTCRDLDVRVATAMPYYPQWEIYPAYRRSVYRSELRNGATIFRAWHRVRPAPSAIGRDLQEATLRSEEHTSELQSPCNLVCRLLLEQTIPRPQPNQAL